MIIKCSQCKHFNKSSKEGIVSDKFVTVSELPADGKPSLNINLTSEGLVPIRMCCHPNCFVLNITMHPVHGKQVERQRLRGQAQFNAQNNCGRFEKKRYMFWHKEKPVNMITQHIPGGCDVAYDEPDKAFFNTTEELLNIDFVKRHSKIKGFSHYAMSGDRLMVISNEGKFWWVLGYIKRPELVDLPKWEGGRF
jgi:hypothetical protein